MTPKEKAFDLINQYSNIDLRPFSEHGDYIAGDIAKQCALIAVNEMVSYVDKLITEENYRDGHLEYLQEVKQEIEKK